MDKAVCVSLLNHSVTLSLPRVQSLQALAVQEASEANKPLVERELAILSAFCHHIYPTLQEGEQHPVSIIMCIYIYICCL